MEYKLVTQTEVVKFDIDEYLGLEPILEMESNNYENVQKYLDILEIREKDVGRMYVREIIAAKKYYNVLGGGNKKEEESK